MSDLATHFEHFRQGIVGADQPIETPFGRFPMVYADWIASGRLYRPIEERMLDQFGPMVANTHTETSYTGKLMTLAYHEARERIKAHVHAAPHDVLIACGTGMTAAVIKFQRILGLKVPDRYKNRIEYRLEERPLVFITHMEHHSNQTSWLETTAEVHIIPSTPDGLVDVAGFAAQLEKAPKNRPLFASVTACSNVTGIETPYRDIARLIHRKGGHCFVDFACSAPYVDIDMHPADPEERLDAVFFSTHKFLGGPGTPGMLIFNSELYHNEVPDHPGGGTVSWTNPWGGHRYFDDIETREDGGTPGFLQTIRAALAIDLKEQMGTDRIRAREHELLERFWKATEGIPGLVFLAGQHKKRLGAISFYIEGLHFNLAVRLLNDRFGIQSRGGCSCAGTYGHYLLNIDQDTSRTITTSIDHGHLIDKPGWVRLSIHPTLREAEIDLLAHGLREISAHWKEWASDYAYVPHTNEFAHLSDGVDERERVRSWMHL
ncbi:aminotransferase class V-fold PLP-dependent enzyme [bacterium]|nr:aminotransferase class V-fold PLP-dependent enzyme [bacterium]